MTTHQPTPICSVCERRAYMYRYRVDGRIICEECAEYAGRMVNGHVIKLDPPSKPTATRAAGIPMPAAFWFTPGIYGQNRT